MHARSNFFAFAVLVLCACGGGNSESKPKPLKVRYDDALIMQVPMDQRTAVEAAQTAWHRAKSENQKAEADYNEVNAQMAIVKNDRKATELKIDSARASKKVADQSNDANKMNAAQNELQSSEAAKKAADARVKYYEAYRNFLKENITYTAENMYWRESQYELAKSQLGQANALRPPKVNYAEYVPQEQERAKRAEKARDKALSKKSGAASARDSWLKLQADADQRAGARSNFPDPMLQHQNQSSAPAATP